MNFPEKRTTFTQAQKDCEKATRGGSLVEINSSNESAFIKKWIQKEKPNSWEGRWIGLKRLPQQGKMKNVVVNVDGKLGVMRVVTSQ